MGLARKHLSPARRKEIAATLFRVTSEDSGRSELIGLCPIHGEKNASFAYNYERDAYNCLSCQATGDLVRLFCEVNGYGQAEGIKIFCERFGIDRSGGGGGQKGRPEDRSTKDRFIAESVWEKLPSLPAHWVKRLTVDRGWSEEVIRRFDLRLYHDSRRGEERVAIPIRDGEGRLGNIRKYLPGASAEAKVYSWSKGFGRTRLFPAPGQWSDGLVVICEGESDCLCALSHGINGVTQTAGAGTWRKDFSREFVGRDVVIAYDADLVGLAGAEKVAAALSGAAKLVRIISWPDFMLQAGTLPEEHGQDLTDFFMRHGRSAADFMDLLAKAQTIQAADDEGPFRYFRQGASGHWAYKSNLLAREILAEHSIITDGETGRTYRWEGAHWDAFPEGQIRRLALNKLGYEATSARAKDAAAQVVDLALLDPGVTPDPDPNLLCLNNGTLDLATMAVGPHRKEDLITIRHDVTYDPRTPASCRRWQDFLLETVQIEPIIDELQEFFGYCLTRHTKYERALLLIGPGQDGKSTCLDVLQAMVGEKYVSNVDLSCLDNEFQRAMIYSKLLNVFTEVEAQVLTSAYCKAIVSGDRMEAAYKHKDGFEFRPVCKLAFSSNRFPKVQDNSNAFFRRLLPIRFRWQVPNEERDPDLREKLLAEIDGIFAWALEGLRRLQARGGFDLCDMTLDVLNEYKFSNNPIIGFIEECTTEDNQFLFGKAPTVSKADLYGAYKDYCVKYGFGPMNDTHFSREMLTLKPKLKTIRPSGNGRRERYWEGITLVRNM